LNQSSFDMKEIQYSYSLDFSVRDYECDLQGVVNNANYQHYFEHARHEFLISKGISFAQLHDEGIDLIVTKVEIEYKYSLRSCDKFIVTVYVERQGNVRLAFIQDIFRSGDGKHIAHARVTGAATKQGRPVPPGDLITRLGLE
jgi:acyl-CoA thioester hydrolase